VSDIAIRTEALSKRYYLGKVEKYQTLREAIARMARAPLRMARGGLGVGRESFWALQDVSVEIKQGEVVGVIGRNGAGKTTLLKLLSRITAPTAGQAWIYGRVGSLLEVGTGFHPELTGRDNVFLNGAIIGMRRAEIMRKFDEIVEFAEIDRFIDTPVKRYSSGMHARLAFAVAAHLEPDILIVDEVLAVGDAAFQRKCIGKMDSVAKGGRTVLFVSHNLSAAAQLCSRGILLSGGKLVRTGPIDDIVAEYIQSGSSEKEAETLFPERPKSIATIVRLTLTNAQGRKTVEFFNDERISLEVEYVLGEAVSDNHLFVLLDRVDGLLVLKSSDDDYHPQAPQTRISRQPGRYTRRVQFPASILNEGSYQFRIVLGKRRGELDQQKTALFHVEDRTDYRESCLGKRNGVVLFPLEWSETVATDSGPAEGNGTSVHENAVQTSGK
jgi:lipopolysaccharide transport system ATP-binding protein